MPEHTPYERDGEMIKVQIESCTAHPWVTVSILYHQGSRVSAVGDVESLRALGYCARAVIGRRVIYGGCTDEGGEDDGD